MTFLFGGHTKLLKYILAQDWDAAIFELYAHPREAKRWGRVQFDSDSAADQTSFLPLHQAVSLNPPLFMIETLLSAHPEATYETDSFFQRTPLHIACLKGASVDVLRLLLRANPASAGTLDSLGRVPIHYATFSHSPADILSVLLDACPDAATVQDKKGWLPVHVAVRFGATREVVGGLVDAYPGCVALGTASGMTPLDCARRFGVCHEAGVLALLEDRTGAEDDDRDAGGKLRHRPTNGGMVQLSPERRKHGESSEVAVGSATAA